MRVASVRREAHRRGGIRVGACLAFLLHALAACHPPLGEPVPAVGPPLPVPATAPAHTLLLIGDAGAAEDRNDPVMDAVHAAAAVAPARTTVAFLGDNIYPSGLPARTAGGYERGRRRLDAQLAAIGDAGGFFIAGNHDWGGWRIPLSRSWRDEAALAREGDYLAAAEGGRIPLVPPAGCAGPALVRAGPGLVILAIDSQWWLLAAQDTPPSPPASDDPACAPRTLDEAAARLRTLLHQLAGDDDGSHGSDEHPVVVVVGHHPLESVGPHGSAGGSDQELHAVANVRMRAALRGAFTGAPPLLYAAGHDHLLQLFAGPGARYTVGSGAGSKLDPIRSGAPWLFARSAPGFVRLDLWVDGGAALSVTTVDDGAGPRTVFCRWLAPAAAEGRSCAGEGSTPPG